MTAGYPPVKRKVRNEKNVISKLLIQGHPLEEGKDEFLKPRQDLPHYDRPGGLKDLLIKVLIALPPLFKT